jgi:hypothetical protein
MIVPATEEELNGNEIPPQEEDDNEDEEDVGVTPASGLHLG